MVNPARAVAMLVLAAWVAAGAATAWWMLVDDIALWRAMRTPFPYLMLAAATFIGVPAWVAADQWLGNRLVNALVTSSVAILPAVLLAWSYFLYPRSAFAAFLLLSTVWVGTTVFWLLARRVRI